MTVHLWRIATETQAYAADDMSGTGAYKTGGRWNSKGSAVLYTSSTIALACLETLAHLNSTRLPLRRFLVRFDIPDDVWDAAVTFDSAENPGWAETPAGFASQNWGNRWLAEQDSAIALVPSAIIPEERNALINPAHQDTRKITAHKVRPWKYDARIV